MSCASPDMKSTNGQSSEEALTGGFGEQALLLPKQTDDYRKNFYTR